MSTPTPPIAMHVLLVEDHPINQKLVMRLLEKWGHRTTLAQNGQEAVQQVAQGQRFDAILMDMQMPVMDGLDATRHIRQLEADKGWPRHAIVAMTANAMQGDREACLAAGMDDYLAKPINHTELADKLQRYAPAPSAPLATFDYRAALQGADPEILGILTPIFLEHYEEDLQQLRQALERNQAAEAMRYAHSLKGTLASFCAQPGAEHAAHIESLTKAGHTTQALPLLDPLEEAVAQLLLALQDD